jgi:hypothetical protein
MSVPAGTAREVYYGSGSPGPFAFNFKLYDQTHLRVIKTSLADVDTVLTMTTDYVVSLAADFSSATILLVADLDGDGTEPNSEQLTLVRNPPISQLIQWPRNDPFPSVTHERAADLAVMLIDRLNEKVDRSLLLPESASVTGLTLPNPEAELFLRWNAAGDALENMAIASVGTLIVSPFMQTVLDDANAAAARTTLGALASSAVSAFGLTLIDDADAGTARTTLGAAASTVTQGKQTIWIPAGAIKPRVTNGAGQSTFDSGASDITIDTMDFDQTTAEFGHFTIALPKQWNKSTVTFQPFWTATAGSAAQTAILSLAGVAISNDDVMNATFGTAVTSSDALIATGDLHVGPESAAVTIAGTPADDDICVFQLARDISDTLASDLRLIGIKLFITTNAATDA